MHPEIPVWGKGAILNDAWFILISQLIFTPLMNTVNPWYFMYMLRIKGIESKIKNGTSELTQAQAHQMFEKPVWDPAFSFSTLLRILYTVIFFQPILPTSSIYGAVTFFLVYWSHKHRILRMSVRPLSLSDNIAISTQYFISLGVLVYGVACALMLDKLHDLRLHQS